MSNTGNNIWMNEWMNEWMIFIVIVQNNEIEMQTQGANKLYLHILL